MNIIRFIDDATKTHTYLICSNNNNAIILDPVADNVDLYLNKINSLKLNLLYTLDTHIHADHVTGASFLRDRTKCKVLIGEHAEVKFFDKKLHDQESLIIDNLNIKILHTPGHTSESYCYLINDRLFSGDCLLINGCGRTDFQNGDPTALYNSIFNILLKLPDETIIYPGHDYNNKMVSTILQERLNNPRLQVNNVSEFVNIMNNLNLPKPKQIDIAVPRNILSGRIEEEQE